MEITTYRQVGKNFLIHFVIYDMSLVFYSLAEYFMKLFYRLVFRLIICMHLSLFYLITIISASLSSYVFDYLQTTISLFQIKGL